MNAQRKPATARRLSILIADDELDTVATLSALLSDEGHVVHYVLRGDLVANAVKRYKPEVCILDIEMPGRNGYELAKELSGAGAYRPRLIAISGKYVREAEQQVALALGFDRFFTKPADPQELLALLDQIAAGEIVNGHVERRRERRHRRVLVADDNRDTVMTTTALLRDEGYEVREANNGRDALVQIADFDPDVIVADIKMPGMTGWELARAVRRTVGFERPLLIAISGHYKKGADRVLTNIAGFNHFLPKPYEMKDLLALIERRKAGITSFLQRPTDSPAAPTSVPTVTVNITRNGGWPSGPWLWVSAGPMPPFREGETLSAEISEAGSLAIKVERLLREPFLADVKRLGYKRAIERLEVAVAAIRALGPTAVAIVDRGAAQ